MKNDALMRTGPKALIELMENHVLHLEKEYVLHHHVCDRLNIIERNWLGIPMIILSAVSTGAYLQIFQSTSTSELLKFVPIFCSIASMTLASLMTFLDLSAKAIRHHNSASNYYNLLNQCIAYLADPEIESLSPEELRKRERDIAMRMYDLLKDSPPIPGWAYAKVNKLIENEVKLRAKLQKMRETKIEEVFD